MKTLAPALAGAVFLAGNAAPLQAAVTSIVGYVDHNFTAGINYVNSSLWAINGTLTPQGPQAISDIFSGLTIPTGTTIELWNSTTESFLPATTYDGTNWIGADHSLPVGTGFQLTAPSAFNYTVTGHVDDYYNIVSPHDGIGPGLYLLGSNFPGSPGGVYTEFDFIIGRAPNEGETIQTIDQLYSYIDTGSGLGWYDEAFNPVTPQLDPGEAAFFNLIPEPVSSFMLALGSLFLLVRRRH